MLRWCGWGVGADAMLGRRVLCTVLWQGALIMRLAQSLGVQ